MDVVPKNAKEVAKFLNCWAPSRSQISEHLYGYLMVTEGVNTGGIHNISRPVSLAISHPRNMFPLVLRSAGQPIPSTVWWLADLYCTMLLAPRFLLL